MNADGTINMLSDEFITMNECKTSDQQLEGLRFLLFRYGRTPSPLIAGRIAVCLDSILTDSQIQISGEERRTYRQMRSFWRLIAKQG